MAVLVFRLFAALRQITRAKGGRRLTNAHAVIIIRRIAIKRECARRKYQIYCVSLCVEGTCRFIISTLSLKMSDTTQHLSRSCSDGEQEPERPERMRDWLIRMINSPGRFPGLEWLDPEKTVFKVPWIHAKKRGYNRERDAALFKAWAIHSGKYRDESDPTVWKINFRCAINGLKDIVELKDLQTEDCRVYKVLPSTRRNKRKRRNRSNTDPYSYPPGKAAAIFSAFACFYCGFPINFISHIFVFLQQPPPCTQRQPSLPGSIVTQPPP